jgi:Uma2 family endonuclease
VRFARVDGKGYDNGEASNHQEHCTMTVGNMALSDLLYDLGDVSPTRVRLYPYPGTATVEDVERIQAEEGRFFELVGGVLVEKAMGFKESALGLTIGFYLKGFVLQHHLGVVAGEAGLVQLIPSLVRGPDVSVTLTTSLPGGKLPDEPVPALVPDLVVEVLSKSNTRREMQRKLDEYLSAGVRVIWFVDPEERVVDVYAGSIDARRLTEADVLNGGEVLPGFTLPLGQLFAELD